jgi:hypothetical protein
MRRCSSLTDLLFDFPEIILEIDDTTGWIQ